MADRFDGFDQHFIKVHCGSGIMSSSGLPPTTGDDSITLSTETLAVSLLGGDDFLNMIKSTVTVDGGNGNDIVVVHDHSTAAVECGDGNDGVRVGENVFLDGSVASIDGGAGDDNVSVLFATASIDGGSGNDILAVGGTASIDGGDGTDTVFLEGRGIVDGGGGNDSLQVIFAQA